MIIVLSVSRFVVSKDRIPYLVSKQLYAANTPGTMGNTIRGRYIIFCELNEGTGTKLESNFSPTASAFNSSYLTFSSWMVCIRR